jgi:UDP-glucose:(heptosyl)LPS alpha-1,3-glucosyltransferase
MKLGFLLFDYFRYGGLQRDCLKIARLCVEHGHESTVFTRTWQGHKPREVRIELFGRHGFSNVGRNRAWLEQLGVVLPQRELDGLIGFNKLPGLDLYYGSDPCYVAKVKRLKPPWFRLLPRFRHFAALEKAVFQHGSPTHILLLTPHEIPLYQKAYGTEAERFHLLPPGIERQEFSESKRQAARQRTRAHVGWPMTDRVLLFVGSGFRVKGLDRAISALAALPAALREQSRLIVIGQNRFGAFARQARRLGVADRVHFLGGRDDVPEWLLASDVLVHPAYSESAGMILLEAMAVGLPVLTTDACGYASHVDGAQAGKVLPSPFSQAACNDALVELLTSGQVEAWRSNGLAYAAQKDLYSCHERAAVLIEEIVCRKRSRAQPPKPSSVSV